MFILIAVSLITLFVIFYIFQTSGRRYWNKDKVPFASGSNWFFGHYKQFFFQQKQIGETFQDIYNEYPESPYVGYMKMLTPGIAIRDPELVKCILSTDYNYFSENEFKVDKKNDFLLGNNPFVLTGTEWKTVRSHSTPLITFVKLKSYFPAMRGVSQEMIQFLRNKCESTGVTEVETKKFSGTFTTDIIANAILGVKNNAFQDENSLFGQIISKIFTNDISENLKVFMALTVPKLAPFLGLRFASKEMQKTILSLTRKQMAVPTVPGQVKSDIFQQMKVYRENDKSGTFSDEYIASHCFSFLTDGYETSSDLLCFTFFELAWHSEVQDRLRDEIMSIISETNDEYNVEHIEKLKYLDMVICESQRMYPPVTALTKICSMDYKVPNSSLVLKKGTPTAIPIYALHKDEKYYKNANQFDPERFTEEAVAARNKFVFLPFGEGPRKCPGQRFALLQVKLAIVNVLQHFRLKPSPKSKYPAELDPTFFISRPKGGAWVQIEAI